MLDPFFWLTEYGVDGSVDLSYGWMFLWSVGTNNYVLNYLPLKRPKRMTKMYEYLVTDNLMFMTEIFVQGVE